MSLSKKRLVLATVCLGSIIILFQNCSRIKFSGSEESASTPSTESIVQDLTVQRVSEKKIVFDHIANSRKVSVEIAIPSDVDLECQLEYEGAPNQWASFTDSFDCSRPAGRRDFLLPGANNWTAQFNATGINVRILDKKSERVLESLPNRLKCVVKASSATQTPLVDENCNGIWDDVFQDTEYCEYNTSRAYGGAYSCPATQICQGSTVPFHQALWGHESALYTDGTCSTIMAAGPWGTSVTRNSPTGQVPPSNFPSGCQLSGGYYVNVSAASWTMGFCRYSLVKGTSYN